MPAPVKQIAEVWSSPRRVRSGRRARRLSEAIGLTTQLAPQLHPGHPSEPRHLAVVLSGVRGRGLVRAPDTAAKAHLPRRGGLIDDIGQYVVVVLSPVIDKRGVVAVRGVWDVTDSHRYWRGDGIPQYDGVLRCKARELPQEVTRSEASLRE